MEEIKNRGGKYCFDIGCIYEVSNKEMEITREYRKEELEQKNKQDTLNPAEQRLLSVLQDNNAQDIEEYKMAEIEYTLEMIEKNIEIEVLDIRVVSIEDPRPIPMSQAQPNFGKNMSLQGQLDQFTGATEGVEELENEQKSQQDHGRFGGF